MIQQSAAVHPLADAAVQPDLNLTYRLLFDCRTPAGKVDGPNPGLSHLARLINLFEPAGVSSQRMDLAAVMHGPTTRVALRDEEYRNRFGSPNPDSGLIGELVSNGGRIYVCGQSMLEYEYPMEGIHPGVTLASSALAVLANLQLQGFALMSY